jgi:hypothetical protein
MNSSEHPLYSTWHGMRQRCNYPKHEQYSDYGGRGIRVCPEWDDFLTFVKDVGDKPSPVHQLDRKENDGDYKPGNVHWVTAKQNARDTRRSNRVLFQGESLTVSEWAERYNIDPIVLGGRLRRGWSMERAVSEDVGTNGIDYNVPKVSNTQMLIADKVTHPGASLFTLAEFFGVSKSTVSKAQRKLYRGGRYH